jgi:hypothetical protein
MLGFFLFNRHTVFQMADLKKMFMYTWRTSCSLLNHGLGISTKLLVQV